MLVTLRFSYQKYFIELPVIMIAVTKDTDANRCYIAGIKNLLIFKPVIIFKSIRGIIKVRQKGRGWPVCKQMPAMSYLCPSTFRYYRYLHLVMTISFQIRTFSFFSYNTNELLQGSRLSHILRMRICDHAITPTS